MTGIRKSLFVAGFLALVGCAPHSVGGLTAIPGATGADLSETDLRRRAGILADDSLRGRETGQPGARTAANYIAGELQRLGFRPAGDAGGYFQSVPLQRSSTSLSIEVSREGSSFSIGLDQILPISGLAGLPESSLSGGEGPIIFAGHLVDPNLQGRELTASQLRGAVVVLRVAVPDGVDPTTAAPRTALAALFGPGSSAAAVLLVAEESEAELWDYASEIAHKGRVTLIAPEPIEAEAPPFFLISEEGAERLIGGPLGREPMTDLGTLRYSLSEQIDAVEAWNVAGILPGQDPERSAEFVALGGHYDHVGVGTPVDGDSIYNGADDNASGTAALLEIAEGFAALPTGQRPARSLMFVWHAAEEAGLLGSEYFTDFPTVSRSAIAAHINLDMVGRNHPDSIFVVGATRLSSDLGTIVEEVNRGLPRPFVLDYSYDPEGHPEMIYCRSDHYSYARYGIPIVFLTTGLHEDYHAPSDEVEKLDFEKMRRVSEFVSGLAFEIADRPSPLRIDKPVPPREAPCR